MNLWCWPAIDGQAMERLNSWSRLHQFILFWDTKGKITSFRMHVIICYLYKWMNKYPRKLRPFICSFWRASIFREEMMQFIFNSLKWRLWNYQASHIFRLWLYLQRENDTPSQKKKHTTKTQKNLLQCKMWKLRGIKRNILEPLFKNKVKQQGLIG